MCHIELVEMCYTEPVEVRARIVGSEKGEALSVHRDEQLYHNAILYGLPRERNPAKCATLSFYEMCARVV